MKTYTFTEKLHLASIMIKKIKKRRKKIGRVFIILVFKPAVFEFWTESMYEFDLQF